MVHGPCGVWLMADVPKDIRVTSVKRRRLTAAAAGHQRRNEGCTHVVRSGITIDNRFLVPYPSPYLCARHNATSMSKRAHSLKYIYKNLCKGNDRAIVQPLKSTPVHCFRANICAKMPYNGSSNSSRKSGGSRGTSLRRPMSQQTENVGVYSLPLTRSHANYVAPQWQHRRLALPNTYLLMFLLVCDRLAMPI